MLVAAVVAAVFAAAGVVSAQAAIVSVVNNDSLGGAGQYDLLTGGLDNGALAFRDRTHEYEDLPDFLIGQDYIKTANVDKRASDLTVDLTIDCEVDLYLFIDERVSAVVAEDYPWVLALGFVNTGLDLGMDEEANGIVNRRFHIWELAGVAPGTITLFEQDSDRESNMYGVAAIPVPEPGSLALLASAGLCFLARHRRGRTTLYSSNPGLQD